MRKLARIVSVATLIVVGGCATTEGAVDSLLGRDAGFASLDRNGDGVLSRAEAGELAALGESFEQIDTNSDSNVNPREFDAASAQVLAVDFGDMDLNGDGVISEREAEATRRSLRDMFASADVDDDGNVSQTEYRAATLNLLAQVEFGEADLDGDGVLDRREAREHALLAKRFDSMDVNNDALVSSDEFAWSQR